MWIMSKIGFFSIVEHKDDTTTLCIRARKKDDLVALRKVFEVNYKIYRTPDADYRFRFYMSKLEFKDKFHKLVELIDYSNFKAEVSKTNTAREQIYHRVWFDLLQIEHEDRKQWFKNYLNEEV